MQLLPFICNQKTKKSQKYITRNGMNECKHDKACYAMKYWSRIEQVP